MAQVVFHLMWTPGKDDLGFMHQAEQFVESGVITTIPTFVCEDARFGMCKVALTMPECDRSFWLGFYVGIDYCRNNRGITVYA